jgi:hypothetical protein
MSTDDQCGLDTQMSDSVGKVFAVLSFGMRKCLVCGGVFTRLDACAHANAICIPDCRSA